MAAVFVPKKGTEILGRLGFSPVKIYNGVIISRKKFDGFDIPEQDLPTAEKILLKENIEYEVVPQTLGVSVKNNKLLVNGQELTQAQEKVLSKKVLSFLDVIGTSFGRATHYNTKQEQEAAELKVHEEMFAFDRGLYAALLALDGVTDHSKQIGFRLLLSNKRGDAPLLTPEQERNLMTTLAQDTPVTRILKMFASFNKKGERINNARTKKIILSYILNSDNIEWWAVKYRRKLRSIMEHAYSVRVTSAMKSILGRKQANWTDRDRAAVKKYLDKFINHSNKDRVYESVSFILGNEGLNNPSSNLISAYIASKKNLNEGSVLPYEVLQGIRSVFHKRVKPEEILKLTKEQLTEKEKMQVQKKAERDGMKGQIKFDASKQDLVSLLIYMYENGATEKDLDALNAKAKKIGESFPVRYGKVGVVVDASASMFGEETQKLRPMATAMALKSIMSHSGESSVVKIVGGKEDNGLIRPSQATDLASGLLDVLEEKPDIVFIITDGYENQPAGRVNELMSALQKAGINTPIQQLTPVMAAESEGIKTLSEFIPVMPVGKPEQIGLMMLKSSLITNPSIGVLKLIEMVSRKLRIAIGG